MATIYKRYVNDPTTTEQDLHIRSGQEVTVLGSVIYDEEVGPVFNIVFADGFTAEAFGDELHEED